MFYLWRFNLFCLYTLFLKHNLIAFLNVYLNNMCDMFFFWNDCYFDMYVLTVCEHVLTALCVGWPWRCGSNRRWWWKGGWRTQRWTAAWCRSALMEWRSCSPRNKTSSDLQERRHLQKNTRLNFNTT